MFSLQSLTGFMESLQGDLGAFAPELWLCATMLVALLSRFISEKIHTNWIALAGVALALVTAYGQWNQGFNQAEPFSREIFQGMLVYDMFTIYLRLFLLAFTLLVIVLTMLTGIPDAEDSADFFVLLLGSVVGMSLMASANHLLMVFMAVEMASVPSYAMAGFLKGRRQSSEAALKYVVYGGAAAGVMLYGISLLAGIFGTVHLPTLAREMLFYFAQSGGAAFSPTLLLAFSLVLVGLAFKLSAFPFHFWCPDVFEGAAAEVAAFLSVASKGAAVALAARLTLTFVGVFHDNPYTAEVWKPAVAALANYLGPTVAVIAAVTATFGNLAAYTQTNLKRLLAYSTIAHAGYMLMALAPMTANGAKAAVFYLFVYLLMNLGAFAVVAFLRNATGSEELASYKGLFFRAPVLTVAMTVFMLSLVGMPPLAGFVAKFQIFKVLYETGWYSLLVIGGINTVISLVYYVNVVRVMIIAGEPTEGRSFETPASALYASVLAALVFYFGIFWQLPETWSNKAASSLVSKAPPTLPTADAAAQAPAVAATPAPASAGGQAP